MSGELINVLEQSDLLRNLPLAVLGPLAETATTNRYEAGDVVFEVDTVDDSLYVVRSGVVELRTRSDGKTLATLRAGQSFGDLAAFDAQPRTMAAVVKTDCELVEVTRSSLVDVFENAPDALMATVANLARSVTEANEEVLLVHRLLDQKVLERTGDLRDTQLELIHRLGTAAEFREEESAAHIYRMSQYCRVIAEGAGLEEGETEELLMAVPMHDVGKIGVPDSVLLKPGALDEDEWRVMQAHTTMGAQILGGSRSPMIQLAEQIALEHHEKWDGSGYPNGLQGERISLEARICTIADVFDALTSDRPYKEAWPFDKALNLVDNSRGTMFDPELVNIFLAEEQRVRDIHEASLNGTLQPASWSPRRIDPDATD